MQRSLTKGPITKGILLFALPLMFGNLLQQMYNIADTWVVGRFLGADALAAVGSSYTLMTFLTSIFLGLSMGSGALFSIYRGKGDERALKSSIAHACGLQHAREFRREHVRLVQSEGRSEAFNMLYPYPRPA